MLTVSDITLNALPVKAAMSVLQDTSQSDPMGPFTVCHAMSSSSHSNAIYVVYASKAERTCTLFSILQTYVEKRGEATARDMKMSRSLVWAASAKSHVVQEHMAPT